MIGILPHGRVGLAVMRALARRFGSDRERAARVCAREAMERLGLESLAGWTRGERLAWDRWAPLVTLLPGIERWSEGQKRAAADVVRAKGGRRESDFVRRFDAHTKLREAVRALVLKTRE